ncbi:MAG: YitT family protein [Crocinitomicaceae bacterium]|nr:YitT family protein [Crocinitomicaceae bacterium]
MKRLQLQRSHKKAIKAELKSYSLIFIGALLLAISYAIFIVPFNVVPGGIFGLSIILHEVIDISVGMIALLINIPLLIWGTKLLGIKIGLKTSFLMVSVSFLLDGISLIVKEKIYVEDVLVSSIFGGILIGLAIAIVKYAGATTGGNDILVRIISIKVKMKFSQLMLIINVVVIALGIITYGNYTIAAYSIIAIVAMSKTIDYLLQKREENKTIIVFSENNDFIKSRIVDKSNKVSSLIQHIHQDSSYKMTVITKGNRKLSLLEDDIYKIDPSASIVVLKSNSNLMN